MPASKRLRNTAGVRGTPTEAQGGGAPSQTKRGLKGDQLPSGRFSSKAQPNPAEFTGVTEVLGGELGFGGGANTFIPRGASAAGDSRAVLDSDLHDVGSDDENSVFATFTVAAGAGASGTFDATAENTGGTARVEVYLPRATQVYAGAAVSAGPKSVANANVEDTLLGVFYVAANGAAQSIALGAAFASVTVAVYARKVDAAGLSFGPRFGTRRTVAAHA